MPKMLIEQSTREKLIDEYEKDLEECKVWNDIS